MQSSLLPSADAVSAVVGYQRFHFSLWFLLQIRFRFIDRLKTEVPLPQENKQGHYNFLVDCKIPS